MTGLTLLEADGTTRVVALSPAPAFTRPAAPIRVRTAYAAAHVVPTAQGPNTPGAAAEPDWEATLAVRRRLWSWGLGVADAMDTAQRNTGLDWRATSELIRRSAAEAATVGGALVVGVNTDHLPDEPVPLEQVAAAYRLQLEAAEDAGAGVVLMASRHLAAAARSSADYERVYREVLSAAGAPVILHWLGEAFDPRLAGYFGSRSIPEATDTVLRIVEEHRDRVRGVKTSLLDQAAEVDLRRRLPPGVVVLTGDDHHYVDLIEGDERGHSHALLGAFAAIAPNASAALQALEAGDAEGYRRILAPTLPLSRHVFAAPTPYYKTGIAFLAWLNGHQDAFLMVGGLQSARDLPHLGELVRRADAAGALEQPELAAERWHRLLELHGVPVRRAVRA